MRLGSVFFLIRRNRLNVLPLTLTRVAFASAAAFDAIASIFESPIPLLCTLTLTSSLESSCQSITFNNSEVKPDLPTHTVAVVWPDRRIRRRSFALGNNSELHVEEREPHGALTLGLGFRCALLPACGIPPDGTTSQAGYYNNGPSF